MTADDLRAAFDTLPSTWRAALPGWTAARIDALVDRVREVSGERPIAPVDPFRALRFGAPEAVKVVIFGQDPYPGAGHADGLAFSAGQGKPASLRRVFEVLAADRPGFVPPSAWQLDRWASLGVLLLNPTLSVEIGSAGSHLRCGWQALTSEIVQLLCHGPNPPWFMLWGSQAQQFFDRALPAGATPRVLRTRHPSYDIRRQFMAEGSHFAATADRIDWWSLRAEPT